MIKIDTVKKPVDTIPYTYDTLKTLCNYMANLVSGESPTTYLLRVRKFKMDFVPPSPDEIKKDSFTVKKQKIMIDVFYYIPVTINEAVKKGDKPKKHIGYAQIPKELILKDYDGNLDYMMKELEKRSVSIPEDSTLSKVMKTLKKK